MPAPTSAAPRRNWMASINVDNGAGLRQSIQAPTLQVPTTGAIFTYVLAPEDGFLHSVDFSSDSALTANDTNYVTFEIMNIGQVGTGNTIMSGTNNTKVTGGSSLAAYSKKSLVLSSDPKTLSVKAGDRIRFMITVTGTLGAGLVNSIFLVRFTL